MTEPLVLDERIEVDRPLREVFAYVADFSHIEQWDPGVARSRKVTPGSPGTGAAYHIDMHAGFSLHYHTEEFEQDRRFLFTVNSNVFTAREELLFDTTPDGRTSVRYIAKFFFPTPLRLANRVYPRAMARVASGTMQGLKQALEDRFEPPVASPAIALADKLVLPGIWRFTRLGYRSARRRWNPLSAYLGERHALVTGATSGIGLASARSLAALGARVTLVARDEAKANAVAAQLRRDTGNPDIGVEVCDMSDMGAVHALADRLLQAQAAIDILVNNAGALFNPRSETAEGYERSFALLLLGPYILTQRLQPLLAQSPDARVVNVSSGGMYSQKIHVDDLQSELGKYSGSVAYARAKRGLMILTEEWAEAWRGDGISVNAMHPGWADTPGVETALPGFYKIARHWLRSPEEGADTIVWLAASTEAGRVSGKFWLDREQHPSHISNKTRESAGERAELLATLARMLEESRPQSRRRSRGK